MFECQQHLKVLSILVFHNVNQIQNLFQKPSKLFHIWGLVGFYHMAHIFHLYDDHKEEKDKAGIFMLQFLNLQNISMLHEGFHHHILFHKSEDRSNQVHLEKIRLSAVFVHLQYKFYHSQPKQLRKPSKNHMYFDLQYPQLIGNEANIIQNQKILEYFPIQGVFFLAIYLLVQLAAEFPSFSWYLPM